jgi:WD40 repeat protein
MFYRKLISGVAGLGLLVLLGCGSADTRELPGTAASTTSGGAAPAVARAVPLDGANAAPRLGGSIDPIVIYGCRIRVIDRQEVPSQRDGVLLFIGTAVKPGENVPEDHLIRIKEGDQVKTYRRLQVGDVVAEGELVAMLDNRLARDDYLSKQAHVKAAEEDLKASIATREEAKSRYDRLFALRQRNPGAVSQEELSGAKLTWDRYVYEALAKQQAVVVAEREANQAKTVLDMHDIKSSIPGRIQQIYKHKGEAVKALDPILQIQSMDLVRVEGMIDVQYLRRVRKGMPAVVEPAVTESPLQRLHGHLQEVNCVAVSRDGGRIVSGGEDGRAIVWDRKSRQQRMVLVHPSAVRSVACSPAGAGANLCFTGGADGKGRLWNLDGAVEQAPRLLAGQHRGAITCAAFSPDGKLLATGGEDRDLFMWDAASGELRYRFPSVHRGAVTSLQFLPGQQLISAARDNTLQVWRWDAQAASRLDSLERRSGDVTCLGASPDGKRVLYDQGRTLSILSLPAKVKEAALENPPGSPTFTNFAQFSPDGLLILTAGAAEGRLQLWRAPSPTSRGYEVSQLLTGDHTTPTCAAFAPDGSYLVTGCKEREVFVWPTPTRAEREGQLVAPVSMIGASLDSSSRQVPIWVDLKNDGALLPGSTATIAIYPQ